MELTASKENLKSFIERWEEHPNSPYVFDASASLILPVCNGERNASSGFSSRGCSPSPCESLSSNTELCGKSEDKISDTNVKLVTHDDERKKSFRSTESSPESFGQSIGSTPVLEQNREYLQSFDRRHSDSNYTSNYASCLEKVNLAEEIKKLSDRLLMLSSISAELQEYNQRTVDTIRSKSSDSLQANENSDSNKKASKITMSALTNQVANDKTISTEAVKNWKNSKTNNLSDFKLSRKSGSNTSTSATDSTHVQELTEPTIPIEESSRFENILSARNRHDKSVTNDLDGALGSSIHSNDTPSSSSTPNNSVPWPVMNRRTKFRMTQLSRDVSHDTIFLEEAANTTKCLLHLLDKYNGKEETRSTNGIRRHQSISVSGGFSNNLEYQSMNSINAFFKRSVFQKNGTIVKQMQTRLEAKRNQ